ncbi:group II intron reverse transcriptase/maturase [Marinobacter salarius]|uniref:group II intron reverse transcriptase/maturase n=1 Tax=Marinobacter salarius TaxID=1420917 RepID=UPI0032F4EDF1
MTLERADRVVETPPLITGERGQYLRGTADQCAGDTVRRGYPHEEPMDVISAVLERPNMQRAYDRVMRNKGAPGVDGLTVADLKGYLKVHWPRHRQELLEGTYQPQPVRAVEIPKPGGGVRQLGIPTVLDRLIQQALHQVLSPVFEPGFSESSYGFRPGRNAGQAVKQARDYVEAGYRWVVDIDLEAFFDRVNHDMLMARVARQVKDKRALKLIRGYLEAGICTGGLVTARREGTPQGGPLSPLLSNILLTDLDRELGKRGHAFCRYADDCNIYVRSERAGERVLESVTHYLEKTLKLKVNREKSGVGRPWQRKFLGYTVCNRRYNVRLRVDPKAVKRLRGDLKAIYRRGRGRSLGRIIEELNPKLRGWINYFRHIGVKSVLEELDGWIRRHLRQVLWLQWKRSYTRAKNLMRLGLEEERAWNSAQNGRGPWWNAGASHLNQALPKKLFDRLGLVSLIDYYHRLKWAI